MFRYLGVRIPTAPGSGKAWIYDVLKNGSPTGLTFSIENDAVSNGIAFDVTANGTTDTFELRRTSTGSPTSPATNYITVVCDGVDTGVSGYGYRFGPNSTQNYRGAPFCPELWTGGTDFHNNLAATPGSVVGYAVDAGVAPGSGKSWTFVWEHEGVLQDGTGGTIDTSLVIADAAVSNTWDGDLPFAIGERTQLIAFPTNSPTGTSMVLSVKYAGSVDGESHLGGPIQGFLPTSAGTWFFPGDYGTASQNTTESPVELYNQSPYDFDVRTMRVRLSNAAADALTFSVRRNGTSPSGTPSATVAASGTDGDDAVGAVTISQDDRWNVQDVQTGTFGPGSVRIARYGMVQYALAEPFEPPDGILCGSAETFISVFKYLPEPETGCPFGRTRIFVNDVERTDRLHLTSIDLSYTLGGRGTLDGLLIDKGPPISTYLPELGDVITLVRGIRMFHGELVAFDEAPLADTNTATGNTITAVNFHRLLEKRLYTGAFGQFRDVAIIPWTRATASVRFAGDNNDMILTSREGSAFINNLYSLTMLDPGDSNVSLSHTEYARGEHVVTLATDGSGNIVTTAADIKALEDDFVFWVDHDVGSDGSGTVGPLAKLLLTGAKDAEVIITTELKIIHVAAGNPAIVVTGHPHQLATGDHVELVDVIGLPALEGEAFEVTVLNVNQFSIPFNATVEGLGGQVLKLTRLQTIVEAVVTAKLLPDLGLHPMTEGPWITPKSWIRETVESVLREICDEAEWLFRVTTYPGLQVFEPGSSVATFTLNNDTIVGATSQRRSREEYSNTLIVVGGQGGQVVQRTDTFFGDGSTQQWDTTAPYMHFTSPHAFGYVTVDDVAFGMGVFGLDVMEWTFEVLDNGYGRLHHSGTPPASGTVIALSYMGDSQIIVTVSDPDALAADNGVVYETEIDGGNLTSIAHAKAYGESQLPRYTLSSRVLNVSTMECLVFPGTVIPLDHPSRRLDASWMTVRVRAHDVDVRKGPFATSGYEMLYSYELLANGTINTWMDFWKQLRSK